MCLVAMAGCDDSSTTPASGTTQPAKKMRIGVSIPAADHGWTAGIGWWAQRAMALHPEIEWQYQTADTPQKQIEQIETMMTKGVDGSEIYTKDGFFRVGSERINKMVDSVGAGDGYAAMLAAGILGQWHPDTIIHRASLFASQICTLAGAIPESSSFYKPFADMIEE